MFKPVVQAVTGVGWKRPPSFGLIHRSEGWGPCPEAATSTQGIAKGAMDLLTLSSFAKSALIGVIAGLDFRQQNARSESELIAIGKEMFAAYADRYRLEWPPRPGEEAEWDEAVAARVLEEVNPASAAVRHGVNIARLDQLHGVDRISRQKAIPEAKPGQIVQVEPDAGYNHGQAGGSNAVTAERQARMTEFKSRARALGIKVTDEMVANAANPKWNDRSMVTWWKRNDPRCKRPHDKLIRSVLAKDPSLIWPPDIKLKTQPK